MIIPLFLAHIVPPRTPLDVTVVNVTTTSVTISWRIPTVLYQQEEYYVRYGLNDSMLEQRSSSQMSGDDITNIIYNVTIENLHPDYTYFFVVTAENIIAAKNSELSAFTTLEAGNVLSIESSKILRFCEIFSTKWTATQFFIDGD